MIGKAIGYLFGGGKDPDEGDDGDAAERNAKPSSALG
jgi:hypothetical protein